MYFITKKYVVKSAYIILKLTIFICNGIQKAFEKGVHRRVLN